MGRHEIIKKRNYNGIKFILYPIAFFAMIALVCTLAVGPVLAPYAGAIDLFVFSKAPDFHYESSELYSEEKPPEVPVEDVVLYSDDTVPKKDGDKFGVVVIESAGISVPLIYGDGTEELKKGVGCYRGAYLPGQGRTVLMGGHRSIYLGSLYKVKQDDLIELRTSYGDYVYRVTGKRVARYDDKSACDLSRREDNLILYTCQGAATIGATPDRLFVYAEFVSGPRLVYWK